MDSNEFERLLLGATTDRPPFEDDGIEPYEQYNISVEEREKIGRFSIQLIGEINSRMSLVDNLQERLKHIYSNSFSLSSAAATPDPLMSSSGLSAIEPAGPAGQGGRISPLPQSVISDYLERAEKEIARLEECVSIRDRQIEDLIFEKENLQMFVNDERERFRKERVKLKTEIVELGVVIRGLKRAANGPTDSSSVDLAAELERFKKFDTEKSDKISRLSSEVAQLRSLLVNKDDDCQRIELELSELRSMRDTMEEVFGNRKNFASQTNACIILSDTEWKLRESEMNVLKSAMTEIAIERDDYEMRIRRIDEKKFSNAHVGSDEVSRYCDIGIETPKASESFSTVCCSYSLVVPSVELRVAKTQTMDAPDKPVEDLMTNEIVSKLEAQLSNREEELKSLRSERKTLYTTIEDLEDSLAATTAITSVAISHVDRGSGLTMTQLGHMTVTAPIVVDTAVPTMISVGNECEIWPRDMKAKYDGYKKKLLDVSIKYRELKSSVGPSCDPQIETPKTPTHSLGCMTDIAGDILDRAIVELREERDMYWRQVQTLQNRPRDLRECWSQTPEKKTRASVVAASSVETETIGHQSVGCGDEAVGDVRSTCQGDMVVIERPTTQSIGIFVDEITPLLHEANQVINEKEGIVNSIQTELNMQMAARYELENALASSRSDSGRLEDELAVVRGLYEASAAAAAAAAAHAAETVAGPQTADDSAELSAILKPLQEKFVSSVAAPASLSTCSPTTGLFDYSNSTMNNPLSSVSPLRLEMATPRDKDGDILMMTVKKRTTVTSGEIFKIHEDPGNEENIAPTDAVVQQQPSRSVIMEKLSTIKNKASVVTRLADRIAELAASA